MQLLYSTYFQVSCRPDEGITTAFGRVSDLIRRWLAESYERRQLSIAIPDRNGFVEPLPGHVVLVRTQGPLSDGTVQTRFTWRHTDSKELGISWHVNATISVAQGIVEFAITISRAADSIRVPPTLLLGRPRVVRDLLVTERCSVNNLPLGVTPAVVDEPGVDDFVEDSLLSSNRTLPILLVSPENDISYCVAPDPLADKLAGLCSVVALESRSATFRLTDLVGRELSCFNGASRLYWPGLALNSKPWQHPLFLPAALKDYERGGAGFHREVVKMLSSAFSLRTPQGPITRQASYAFAKARRDEIEDVKKRYEQGLTDQKEFEGVLKLVEEERDNYKEEFEKAKNRADLLLLELDAKTQELEEVRKNWRVFEAYSKDSLEPGAPSSDGEESVFSSVEEAVRVAADDFSENVEILDTAIESAADCPFQNPARVYKILQAIDEVGRSWKKSLETKTSMGGGLVEAFRLKGIDFKKEISQTSRAKFEEDYTFNYNGRKQIFEQHITEGAGNPNSCFSVHMLFDKNAKKIAVAHVGKHLPNTST